MFLKDYLALEFSRLGLKTVKQMSDRSGINYQYLRDTLIGKSVPSDKILFSACQKLGLSDEKTREIMIAAAKERRGGKGVPFWDQVKKPPVLPSDLIVPSVIVKIPIFKSVKCSSGDEEVSGEKIDDIPFPEDYFPKGTFGLVVDGTSMAGGEEPIYPGEYAVFEPWTRQEPPIGETVCVCVEGWPSAACKKIFQEPDGTIVLASNNPAYPPIMVDPKERWIKVHGIYVGSWKPARRSAKKTGL